MMFSKSGNRSGKIAYSRRWLALVLCVSLMLSVFGDLLSVSLWAADSFVAGFGQEELWEELPEDKWEEISEEAERIYEETADEELYEETTEEIKARLLWQIRYAGWDPYSSDMTLNEFYALMEMFQEGILPLKDEESSIPDRSFDDTGFDVSWTDEPWIDDSLIANPNLDEAVTEDSDTDDPISNEPSIDEPVADEPSTDGSGTDEPGTNEPSTDEPGTEEPDTEEPAEDTGVLIPRTMFMFSGLSADWIKFPENTPLNYNTNDNYEDYKVIKQDENGNEVEEIKYHYPAGLDPYNMGYLRPPKSWAGVPVEKQGSGALQAIVVFAGQNDDKPYIAGDVNQDLFLSYFGQEYYVRRVTAQNTEVSILGAIKLSGQDEYVYYYLTSDSQSSDVSTTTLPAGQKFIVEYYPIEHLIEYQVRWETVNGNLITDLIPEETPGVESTVNVLGTDMRRTTWEDIIFGATHPYKTDGGAYSFTAYAPYGYTVEFYLLKREESDEPTLMLGTKSTKDADGNTVAEGAYKGVNKGWALGMEPDYIKGTTNGAHVYPSSNGPNTLTMSGSIYNDSVHHNRTVIAVVTKNESAQFLVAPIKQGTDHVKGRGSSASTFVTAKNRETGETETIPYDYEDVFLWVNGGASKYEYTIAGLGTKASEKNMQDGNIATNDGWGWSDTGDIYKDGSVAMNREDDGTYSYQWTWQTNDAGQNYTLDSLEVNGLGITLPFAAKTVHGNHNGTYKPATGLGNSQWYTETILPDGAVFRVELLKIFNNTQRVYRITVTGARSNITISSMNLMQYNTGAPEFSVYYLDGVTGATQKGDNVGDGTHSAAIQYYHKDDQGWSENTPQGTIVVYENNGGINYNGDPDNGHANLRFKLADGYDSPYYLWESSLAGVIDGTDGMPQASIERNEETGYVDYSTMNQVLSLSDVLSEGYLDSRYIYKGDDGWYYIRVSTQGSHKMALLTIVARQVRYVVRYIPSYDSVRDELNGTLSRSGSLIGSIDNPGNMPQFDHSADGSHDSFDTEKGMQYDTKDGAYYDTTVDDIARLPAVFPTDPGEDVETYRFVDWVLVDENFNPVWAWTNAAGISVQVTTDIYGNRFLITPGNMRANDMHHPALWDDEAGELLIGYQYTLHWNGSYYDLINIETQEEAVPENWVTLTRDGKLAYAANGRLVEMPENTDLTAMLANWCVRDANGDAATISGGSEFHYRANHINLIDVNQYAISNDRLGGDDTDIQVLRLMPTWELVDTPFNYRVALNWVDAQGNVYEEFFDEYWNNVMTNWSIENGGLTVQVIKEATPFKDWIAMHPTYGFWDDVNNNNALFRSAQSHDGPITEEDRAAMSEQMAAAIADYLPELAENPESDEYKEVLKALCRRDVPDSTGEGNGEDDFWRLGGYAFQVFEDWGTIVVWMYEDKGGLVFHKDVKEEPFVYDDEFYFTVDNVVVGANGTYLKGTYKAYPEHTGVYKNVTDKDGNIVRREEVFKDSDAWLVEFKDGRIVSVVKNDGSAKPSSAVNYFTLSDDDGIRLYVPEGTYTISELGSKSGGSYKVEVEYDGQKTQEEKKNWEIPDGELWLKGSEKRLISETMSNPKYDPDNPNDPNNPESRDDPDYEKVLEGTVSQVSATVDFKVGERNVVHTLIFHNETSTLAIEKQVVDSGYVEIDETFAFEGEIILPPNTRPLQAVDVKNKTYYYFNYNQYNFSSKVSTTGRVVIIEDERWDPTGNGYRDGCTRWTLGYLIERPAPDYDGNYNWGSIDLEKFKNNTVKLHHNERITVVITVPEQDRTLDYVVQPSGLYNDLGIIIGPDDWPKLSYDENEDRVIVGYHYFNYTRIDENGVVQTGRIVVEEDKSWSSENYSEYVEDSTRWKIVHLRTNPTGPAEDPASWTNATRINANQLIGEHITVILAEGGNIGYSVKENVPDGYTLLGDNPKSGKIGAGELKLALFQNAKRGTLTIRKEIEGATSADKQKEFTFTVTLTLDNKPINDKFQLAGTTDYIEFKNGVATITLKAGESKTITGLLRNIKYTVTESDPGDNTLNRIEAKSTFITGSYAGDEVENEDLTINKEKASVSGVVAAGIDDEITFYNNPVNKQLPVTGGVGTNVFYILGGLLTLCSAVYLMLADKKRA